MLILSQGFELYLYQIITLFQEELQTTAAVLIQSDTLISPIPVPAVAATGKSFRPRQTSAAARHSSDLAAAHLQYLRQKRHGYLLIIHKDNQNDIFSAHARMAGHA